jgi:arylformamidase
MIAQSGNMAGAALREEVPVVDWLDISAPLAAGMPTFEGDPPVTVQRVKSLAAGDVCNLTRVDFGAHSGTHIDAPIHFVDGGSASEAISLDACLGHAWVADGRHLRSTITASDIAGLAIPAGETRVLIRTPNSELWSDPAFRKDFVGLDGSAASALVQLGVVLVGIDYLSIAPFGDPTPTHRTLLERGVVILEGLDLRAVEPGPYDIVCLPIRLVGSDGAPARAILRSRS